MYTHRIVAHMNFHHRYLYIVMVCLVIVVAFVFAHTYFDSAESNQTTVATAAAKVYASIAGLYNEYYIRSMLADAAAAVALNAMRV